MRRTDIALTVIALAIAVVALRPVAGGNTIDLVPLSDYQGDGTPAILLGTVGNVLLFLPAGLVLGLRNWTLRRTAVLALAASVAIELLQLVIPGRTTSTDDVILNTLGAIVGWLLLAGGRKFGRRQ
jgi:glycopeptide antibiotics resistance protein